MKKVIPDDAVLIPDSAKRVFKGIVFEVWQWDQELFDGSFTTFEMLKRADTVSAICILENKILVLSEEQPLRGTKKSFPGGRVDPSDASCVEAIKREVHEETGYSFKNWKLVKVFQPQVKNEYFIHIFVAYDVMQHDSPHLDPGEKIEVSLVDFSEAKKMALNNEGFMGESASIFSLAAQAKDFARLVEYSGKEVDR